MRADTFMNLLGADFYTGVPDSQLKALCAELLARYGTDPKHHIIAANEGNCVGIAAGYHLATGKVPVVYLQNSGEGNIINPAASLLHRKVYGIPVLFVVGWRGEPGVHDEPQHLYQGEITLRLLEDLEIPFFILSKETTEEEVQTAMEKFRQQLAKGGSAAFVVRKGALSTEEKASWQNDAPLTREEIIRRVTAFSGDDPIISTTGKASRELFELRESQSQPHGTDFLTVGSMGHASSIALGVAENRPEEKVWCIDGDGAALMHMGAMAIIAAVKPKNLIHIIVNNGAHESVGGMPTVAAGIDLAAVAKACGYPKVFCVKDAAALEEALAQAKAAGELCLIEVKCAIGARENLGRPTTTAMENKQAFMKRLGSL